MTWARRMGGEITAAEAQLLHALCAHCGPLGVTAWSLATALTKTRNTISTMANELQRKGYCTRERYGARIFLRPTAAGRAFVESHSKRSKDASVDTGAVAVDLAAAPAPAERHDLVPPDNLLPSQTQIMSALQRAGQPITTRRLAELTHLSNRAVHRQATWLYNSGFVFRVREQRRWLWALTRKGGVHLHGGHTPLSAQTDDGEPLQFW